MMKKKELDIHAIEFEKTKLHFTTSNDEHEVQRFLEECPDYAIMERGILPMPGDAVKLINELPPGKSKKDKFLISIEIETNCVGLMELINGYPEEKIWWIGLLLIRPDFREMSLGKRLFLNLEKQLRYIGANEIRLGVLEKNTAGLKFWQKAGFVKIDSKPGRRFGNKTHTVIVMGKQLTSAKLLKENF